MRTTWRSVVLDTGKQASLVIVTRSALTEGICDGVTWHLHGVTPGRPMTGEEVIDLLKGHFIALARAWLVG